MAYGHAQHRIADFIEKTLAGIEGNPLFHYPIFATFVYFRLKEINADKSRSIKP
jgi:hypothetical protein